VFLCIELGAELTDKRRVMTSFGIPGGKPASKTGLVNFKGARRLTSDGCGYYFVGHCTQRTTDQCKQVVRNAEKVYGQAGEAVEK
jgi:hypothetical protein